MLKLTVQHDVTMARKFPLARGFIVAMDRGYNDYDLFAEWTDNGILFVTWLKDNASYVVLGEKDVAGKEHILSDQFIEITSPIAFKNVHMPFAGWSSGMKRISERWFTCRLNGNYQVRKIIQNGREFAPTGARAGHH